MNLEQQDTQSSPIPCPEMERWRQYVQGELGEEESVLFDVHLESCKICNLVLARLENSDLPVSLFNSKELGNAIESQVVDQVVQAATSGRLRWEAMQEHKGQSFGDKNISWATAFSIQGCSAPVTEIGPYKLVRPLAQGGMGRVYLAEHFKLKKNVALKLLPLSMAPGGAVERFEREIQAIGKLSHPDIVQATDAGTDAGYIYLAMEFVDGWDLSQILRSSRRLDISEVCDIGQRIALALSNAHHQGMVHRDIKPSNVMLDRKGNVKLLDFGLVLVDRWDSPLGELTTVGQFLGTLDYMAPEQAEKSAAVDHRSDVYSLGATLYRMLTGSLPLPMLPNQSPLEKLRVLGQQRPVSITTYRKDLPTSLSKLIDSMLEFEPAKRPPSAANVAEELQKFAVNADLRQLASELDQASFQSLPPTNPVVPSPIQPRTRNSHETKANRGRGWWLFGVWGLASMAPFAIYRGINVMLEDENGNLVIESELDDIDLQIVRKLSPVDGASIGSGEKSIEVKRWQIEQGNRLMTLRAGNYEI